jgi:RecB family endonuclease NucS
VKTSTGVDAVKLTDAGRREAQRQTENTPESKSTNRFGGMEHTALINEAAQEAKAQGYQIIGQEVPLGSGKLTDLVIEKDGHKVAVEAETGKAKLAYLPLTC